MAELSLIQSQHKATRRDYIGRVLDEKIICMHKAREYGFDFFDGDRRFGYGGYRYIPGYWGSLTKELVTRYSLDGSSVVLDIGCAKGFTLKEMSNHLMSNSNLFGIDISSYAIHNCVDELKKNLSQYDINTTPFTYKDNSFDLVFSLNTLHNLSIPRIVDALKEISRISKHSYVVVEAYDSIEQQFNMYNWALTAKTLISKEDWKFIFGLSGYEGDYEFITFD